MTPHPPLATVFAVSRAGRRLAVYLAAAVAALGLASGLPPAGHGPRLSPKPAGADGPGDFRGEIEGLPPSAPAGEERGGESSADGESPSAAVTRPDAPSRRLRADARSASPCAPTNDSLPCTSATVGGSAADVRPAALSGRNGFGGPLRC